MGRRTFEEIYKKFGHGLPGRETIVISKSQNFEGDGFRTVNDFQSALDYAKNHFPQKDVFICGGESIYREAISSGLVERYYLTEIDFEPDGDTFFPDFDKKDLTIIKEEKYKDDSLPYTFMVYTASPGQGK